MKVNKQITNVKHILSDSNSIAPNIFTEDEDQIAILLSGCIAEEIVPASISMHWEAYQSGLRMIWKKPVTSFLGNRSLRVSQLQR